MGGVGTLGISLWLPGCAPPSPHPRAQSEAELRQATTEMLRNIMRLRGNFWTRRLRDKRYLPIKWPRRF